MVELRPLDDGNPGQVLDTPHVADLCRYHFFLPNGPPGFVAPYTDPPSVSYFICATGRLCVQCSQGAAVV